MCEAVSDCEIRRPAASTRPQCSRWLSVSLALPHAASVHCSDACNEALWDCESTAAKCFYSGGVIILPLQASAREVWVVTQQRTLLSAAQVALLHVCTSHQCLCQAAERWWLKCAIMGVWAWNNLCPGSGTSRRSSASYWLTPAFVLLKTGWDATQESLFLLLSF